MSGQFSIDRKKEIKEFISKQLSEYSGKENNDNNLKNISDKLDIIIKHLIDISNNKLESSIKSIDYSSKNSIKIDINENNDFIPNINTFNTEVSSNLNINKTENVISDKTINKMKEVLGK